MVRVLRQQLLEVGDRGRHVGAVAALESARDRLLKSGVNALTRATLPTPQPLADVVGIGRRVLVGCAPVHLTSGRHYDRRCLKIWASGCAS